MADLRLLVYQPKDKKQAPWVQEFPEAQAGKMVKMSRWKEATEAEKKTFEAKKKAATATAATS